MKSNIVSSSKKSNIEPGCLVKLSPEWTKREGYVPEFPALSASDTDGVWTHDVLFTPEALGLVLKRGRSGTAWYVLLDGKDILHISEIYLSRVLHGK